MKSGVYGKNNSAFKMNSNATNAASDLLGRGQPYDDKFLRKRVTCLGSGLLLCFIIGGAGLGISIIVLLKFEGTAGVFPQYVANQTEHMKALRDQLKIIQKQVETLNNEVRSRGMTDSPVNGGMADAGKGMLNIDASEVDHLGMDHEHSGHLSKDKTVSDHGSHAVAHEHPSVDSETRTADHKKHQHHGHDHNGSDGSEQPLEHEQDVSSNSHDPHSHHSGHDLRSGHDHHGSKTRSAMESKVESPSISELLCDDSDGCRQTADLGSGFDGSGEPFTEDGSMEETDALDEGSGNCIQYPRPVCPQNFKICYTDDPCPIPVCCL